jgi:hypothetical protein
VGGVAAGAGNVISGNADAGVLIAPLPLNQPPIGNLILANAIGTDPTQTAPLGNGGSGMAWVSIWGSTG